MDRISIQGDMYYADKTLAHNYDVVRMLLIYDMQANGAAPAVTDILLNANPDSFFNVNNLARFRILLDKRWALPQVGANSTNPVNFPKIRINKTLKLGTQYSGTGNTIASIATGSLYLLLLGSQASGSNNTVMELSVRTWFHG